MPININQAQAEFNKENPNIGNNRSDFPPVKLGITEKVLAQYGAAFKLTMAEYANKRHVVNKGELIDKVQPEVSQGEKFTTLQIRVLEYYDFPNLGVKGVKSSQNAPRSPYQFKTLGTGRNMGASLKQYILSGKAKISSVSNDKAMGIGLERKGVALSQRKTLIDRQVATLGYLIKAFGIKATNYFTDAFDETFKDFEITMAEAVGRDIVFTLERLNKK